MQLGNVRQEQDGILMLSSTECKVFTRFCSPCNTTETAHVIDEHLVLGFYRRFPDTI